MSVDEEKHGDSSRAARSAFEDYLGRRSRGEDLDFQAFCAERPELAVGLRLLHSIHLDASEPTLGTLDSAGPVGALLRSPGTAGVEALSAGSRVGPYRIVKELGRGGMGAVFLAEQETPVRRKVALKVIKLGMDTREVVARFEAERQALALMDHPSIARVLDAGATETGRPYFVMELVAGVPITDYCDEHRLDLGRRLELFIRVCEGVQHAHQKGIIHRDLKPSNVLVADQGGEPAPKIIDFGVAKAIDQRLTERSLFTEVGQVIGTPEYMSPEQAGTSGLDIDTRTDIYSLGVLLYQLLTGLLPFDSLRLRRGGLAAIQRIIREEEPARPSTRLGRLGDDAREAAARRGADPRSLQRKIRGDLDWIVMKAMAKDRARRYAGASELAADVRRHRRSEPVLAGPPGAAYRLGKLLRRNRLRLTVSAAVVLLLAGMAAATWLVGEARRREERLRTSEGHHREGLALAREYAALREEMPLLDQRWREARAKHELSAPVWDRPDEITAWEELQRKERALEDRFGHAVLAMTRAVETAPPGSPARTAALRALEDLYWDRHRDAERRRDGPVAEHYKALVQSLGLGTYAREIEGVGRIALQSDPPGAVVHCFRYEEREQRLVPIPFDPSRGRDDPAAGLVGKPYLEVEELRDPERSPFRAGDRLLRLADRPVSLRGEAARIVEEVSGTIEARVMRSGTEVTLAWTPSPGGQEELGFPERHGFTFTGYPLDFASGSTVGITAAGSPLAVELPRGSYLLVFRKDGLRDTRIPLAVPGPVESVKPRLLPESEIPPGFVLIPGGSFPCGGDPEAFQSLKAGEPALDDFFIGRFEVTVAEYLRFVNDPEVLERTDALGEAPPSTEAVRRERKRDEKVWLIPRYAGKTRWERKPGEGWTLTANWRPDWPMLEVSHLAALEYAAWRSHQEPGPWRYRLPTDLEWEKAARGADRRIHVWGNYPMLSFCWSLDRPGKKPAPVGFATLDESVYGVRDLAGSVSEHTSGKTVERFSYRVLRGGGWNVNDEYFFRIATRNGRNPDESTTMIGFRLVAERK